MLSGFKTFAVGLALAVLPQFVAFVTNFDFAQAFGLSPNAATIVGLLMIALRAITNSPIFKGAAK